MDEAGGDVDPRYGQDGKERKDCRFRIYADRAKTGWIFFVAKPAANKDETSFKLIKSTKNEVVFENPAHDFPQRVIYKFEGTKLTGRIEGNNNGKFLAIDFPMNRVKCG